MVYARSTVVSYVSIVNLTLIGLIAEQSGNTYNLYDDVTSQTVESLSVDQGKGEYETTMAFQFILSDIIGSGIQHCFLLFIFTKKADPNTLKKDLR